MGPGSADVPGEVSYVRVIAPPAPSGRRQGARGQFGRLFGDLQAIPLGSKLPVRPLAHLLVLSLILAAMPMSRLETVDEPWVEAVGSGDQALIESALNLAPL